MAHHMRILLIEDNPSLASSIAIGLKNNDFTVDSFMTAGDSEAALETVDYDAVILDLCLPDGDGLDLLRTSRNRGNSVPVLILTGSDSVEERIKGLDCGADDYLLKPFDMDELMARIRALLRRPGGILGITLTSGNISFDTTSREVCIKNKPISISRRELEVLELLMRRRGRVVPKNVL
ncbi:MAG TPA: response regulator transcription factor, partial [Rhodospirillales bacterium]|nr:response regulator transcription factor [Rhodospirillales bacterium]